MSETDNVAPDTGAATETFTPDERAYFDSRGETSPEPKAAEGEQTEAASDPSLSEMKDAVKGEDKKPRMVDYGALAEERGKRKELEERYRQAEIVQARMAQRLQDIMEARAPQRPQQPPSHDEDIFGAAKYDRQRINQLSQRFQALDQQAAEAAQAQQMANWAAAQEAEFKKNNADYDDAFVHLRDNRANELKSVWGLNDFQVQQQLGNEWRQLIMRAGQLRQNPAQFVYEAAKLRGYVKKAPPDDAAKKLDVIEAGQQASKSLSNVGGKAGGGAEVDAMALLKMPPDEYEAWKAKNPAKYRRLMGAAH